MPLGREPARADPGQRPTPGFSSNWTGHVNAADAELVARCKEGDMAAFEALYRQHAPRLYNLAYRMLGNVSDAEDLHSGERRAGR